MTATDYDRLRQAVMAAEGTGPQRGSRFLAYTDTAGKITVGFGRNLTDVGLSTAEAVELLDHDLAEAIQLCQIHFSWFDTLLGIRQRVLVEMAFNLGIEGLSEFSRMLAAIKGEDYRLAASEMLRSQWATQVGSRARRLASMLETGTDATA